MQGTPDRRNGSVDPDEHHRRGGRSATTSRTRWSPRSACPRAARPPAACRSKRPRSPARRYQGLGVSADDCRDPARDRDPHAPGRARARDRWPPAPSTRSCCRAATSTATGTVHRDGVMRLATARDEIIPQRDPRVRENEAYLTVLLLSRVVTRLGTLAAGPHRRRSRACSPPTSRSSRTSTGGSTRRATPRRR